MAIPYRDFGHGSEAAQIIAAPEQDENVNQEQNFVRPSQVEHIRALLLFDAVNINEATRKLETLLTKLDGKRNNKALHWIQLDIAYMFRQRAGEKDEHDQAVPADPTHRQAIAEEVLKLYRFNKFDAAKKLLQKEKLRWVQEETLWMWLIRAG